VIVLELGTDIDIPEALSALGAAFPKGTGTTVHAATEDAAEAILAYAKGKPWPPPHLHK
jgi:hypothetical protein